MRRVLLALVVAAAAGCTSTRTADQPAVRIADTIQTAQDSVNPNDTMPRTRDGAKDSAQ
jgi:hypothetical protein